MDQQTLLTVMTVFVSVAAVALVIQAAMLFGIYKAARGMQEAVGRVVPQAEALLPKAQALLETSHQTVQDSRQQIAEITSRTSEILAVTHKQVQRVDSLLEDASMRARVQMDRAEMVLDDAMGRTQQTVAAVHSGVMKPLQQIQGVAAGLRTAMQFLTRGRPNPAEAHSDEEMFI